MTDHILLPDVPTVVQANADGSQKVFAFPFPVFRDSDVEVRVGTSVVTSGFTVFGAGSSKGGAVAFATAPAAGNRVTLCRKQVYARTEDFLDERTPTHPDGSSEELPLTDEEITEVHALADRAAKEAPILAIKWQIAAMESAITARRWREAGPDDAGGTASGRAWLRDTDTQIAELRKQLP